EEQHRRRRHQPGRDVGAPAHAAGVRAHRAIGGLGDADQLEQLVGAAASQPLAEGVEPADQAEALAAPQLPREGRELDGEADPPADRARLAGHVVAGDDRPAAAGRQERGQDADQRGLPGPVGPQDGQHRARRDRQRDAGQRLGGPEGAAQVLDQDGRLSDLVRTVHVILVQCTSQPSEYGVRMSNPRDAAPIWARPEPGSRRPRFTREQIAAAALAIADAEGMEAVSMRRVAADLGAGTMTLYHYVRTKDELIALMDDAIVGEVLLPDDELPRGWRAAM